MKLIYRVVKTKINLKPIANCGINIFHVGIEEDYLVKHSEKKRHSSFAKMVYLADQCKFES